MIHLFNKVQSKLSTIIVGFDAGSRLESVGGFNPGIAHMLEHCVFKGTSKRSWLDINKEIAFLGGRANAFTSHELVAYYIVVPYENVDAAMGVLSDIVLDSIIPEEEFLKEKEVVKEEEISRLDDVGSFIWNEFSDKFFSNYISNPVIGTQSSIDMFTRDEVFSFYKKYCSSKKGVVSLSSCHSKKYAKELLARYFGKPSSAKVKNYTDSAECSFKKQYINITRPGIEHTYVWIGYPGIQLGSEHSAAARVFDTILGDGMDSRLFTEVREKKGLAYSIGSSVVQWQNGSLFLIDSSTRDENVNEMISLTNLEVDKIRDSLPEEEEVQRAKNKLRTSVYSTLESSYGIAHSALREKIFNEPSIEQMSAEIEKVTREDVKNIALEILDESNKTVLLCRKE